MSEPVGTGSSSDWKAVGGKADAPERPPIPLWAKALGLALIAAIIVLAGVLGASLGRSGPAPTASVSPSPSPSPSPPFVLEPPVQVGEFVAGEPTESRGPAPLNQRIVQATYTDGTDRLLLVMTWPEESVDDFIAGAGIEGAEELTAGTMCGSSVDTGLPACARMYEDTGLLLLAVTEDIGPTVVAALLNEFERALIG